MKELARNKVRKEGFARKSEVKNEVKSDADFIKSGICGDGESFPLAFEFVAVGSGGIHVFTVTHQHLELAVRQDAGLDADESMAQFVQGDHRLDAVRLLVGFPALDQRPLAANLKQGGIVVERDARRAEKLNLRIVGRSSFLAHNKGADGIFVFSSSLFTLNIDAAAKADGIALDIAIPKADELAGTKAGCDSEAVGIDVVIKDTLAETGAGIDREKGTESIRLKNGLFV